MFKLQQVQQKRNHETVFIRNVFSDDVNRGDIFHASVVRTQQTRNSQVVWIYLKGAVLVTCFMMVQTGKVWH